MPNAQLFVEGGRLEAGGQNSYFRNDTVLDGGELYGYFNGAVEVVSDSKLNHGNGYTLLNGELTGAADLTIHGQDTDHYVGIFGSATQFTGDLKVESGALRIGAPAELGPGEIFVGEGVAARPWE